MYKKRDQAVLLADIRKFILQTKNHEIQLLHKKSFDDLHLERPMAIIELVPEKHHHLLQHVRKMIQRKLFDFNLFYQDVSDKHNDEFTKQFGVTADTAPNLVIVDFKKQKHEVFALEHAKEVVEFMKEVQNKWNEHDGDIYKHVEKLIKFSTKYKFALVAIAAILMAMLVCRGKRTVIKRDTKKE